MAPNDTITRPAFGSVLLSFAIGIAVGILVTLPAMRVNLAGVSLSDMGPVGNVLLIGVLSMVVVTTGLFGLYRLFWFVDR